MKLIDQIPKSFYKLFASKYMDYYQLFLVDLYEASGRSYSLLGLTEAECKAVMNERIAETTLEWGQEAYDEEGELLTKANMASVCLKHLEDWGWLRQDYDEALNSYVVSFPEYSRQFVELFSKLSTEDENRERESILAIYSYLHTYHTDKEKNIEILRSAWSMSKGLLQQLAGMQESMRGYFDELSKQRSFLGVQKVLVEELNNTDSKKYAILTTTDSFYRYKEAVKELVSEIRTENEDRYEELLEKKEEFEATKQEIQDPAEEYLFQLKAPYYRLERKLKNTKEASELLLRIDREFDGIERRYNMLIEQKTVFAGRAAARIRYLLSEGSVKEDQTLQLVNIINKSQRKEEILENLGDRITLTERFKLLSDKSLYKKRAVERDAFAQEAVNLEEKQEPLDEFVLKPLYTKQELAEFKEQNAKDGAFRVTEDTVKSMEDLEKLFFVWQEATEVADSENDIEIGEEFESSDGFRFSKLVIR